MFQTLRLAPRTRSRQLRFETFEERVVPALGLGTNITSSGSGILPPIGNGGAVGPDHYVQFQIGNFTVFDKSGTSSRTSRTPSSGKTRGSGSDRGGGPVRTPGGLGPNGATMVRHRAQPGDHGQQGPGRPVRLGSPDRGLGRARVHGDVQLRPVLDAGGGRERRLRRDRQLPEPDVRHSVRRDADGDPQGEPSAVDADARQPRDLRPGGGRREHGLGPAGGDQLPGGQHGRDHRHPPDAVREDRLHAAHLHPPQSSRDPQPLVLARCDVQPEHCQQPAPGQLPAAGRVADHLVRRGRPVHRGRRPGGEPDLRRPLDLGELERRGRRHGPDGDEHECRPPGRHQRHDRGRRRPEGLLQPELRLHLPVRRRQPVRGHRDRDEPVRRDRGRERDPGGLRGLRPD